jgi:hypothetical protein
MWIIWHYLLMSIITFIWIATTTINELKIHKMNIKITLLNGDLNKKVYLKQLNGFVVKG